MAGFNTGEYEPKPVYRVAGGYSNVPNPQGSQVFKVPGTNSFSNVSKPTFGNITGDGRTQTSTGKPSQTDLSSLVAGTGLRPTGADARDAWDGMGREEAQASNPMLDLLYQMFNQAGQGSGGRSVDLSGYDATLGMLDQETERVSERYKKYRNIGVFKEG